ncbi:MAG: rRNA maturation RNase YbeY [Bacteroidetes bacterium]|nr:rRNA maturation RNase YbeY [Bacteroidota bacterium]
MIRFNSKNNILAKEKLKLIINTIFKNYKKSYKYLNINIISDKELVKINKKNLGKDDFTDVISFNYSKEKTMIEGEIYISMERIMENALSLGKEWEEELNRIIIHGALHLCGENDNTERKKMNMRKLENEYLSLLVSRET